MSVLALDINERVSKNEQRLDHHEKLLESQMDKNENLEKLTTLLEMQMKEARERENRYLQENKEREARQEKRDDRQNQQMQEFGDTLKNVNTNLTGLNTSLSQVESRVGKLEDNQNNKKIDLGELGKDIVYKVIPTVLATLITAWLIIQFGLK